jgi:hypothetical protein
MFGGIFVYCQKGGWVEDDWKIGLRSYQAIDTVRLSHDIRPSRHKKAGWRQTIRFPNINHIVVIFAIADYP